MEIQKNLILIVDDVEQNVAVLSQVLRNSGYQVMAAFNGEQALRMVDKRLPDLILLDVMMPGIDGFETCKMLKANERAKDVPVIFLSALSESDTKVKGLETGGVDYISKPFHEAEVVARVGVHLRIRNLERERMLHIEELTRMNAEKDRLVHIVSHDLRSPLGGIQGLATILRDGDEANNPETVRYFCKIMTQSTDTLLNLVNDILDLAKLESGKVELNVSDFDLIEAWSGMSELLNHLAVNKGLTLSVSSSQQQLWVHADRPKLMQMLNNLVTNAIKFTKAGSVQLRIEQDIHTAQADMVLIEVSDSGIGIPEDVMPKLFEKFGKHQRRGTNDEKGTGLGMSIVKRFVDLHNGTIEVESTQGLGTTFRIHLPILKEKAETVKAVVA